VFGLAAALLILIDWMTGSGRRLFSVRRARVSSRPPLARVQQKALTGS
jgi:hypothetical protein